MFFMVKSIWFFVCFVCFVVKKRFLRVSVFCGYKVPAQPVKFIAYEKSDSGVEAFEVT